MFQVDGKHDQFETELLSRLPEEDYNLYCDYDPEGILLEAIQACGIQCRGMAFSARDILPNKVGLQRKGDKLLVKYGYGLGWVELEGTIKKDGQSYV